MPLEWKEEKHRHFKPWVRCYLPSNDGGHCLVYTITQSDYSGTKDQQCPLACFMDLAHHTAPPGLQVGCGHTVDEVKESAEQFHRIMARLFRDIGDSAVIVQPDSPKTYRVTGFSLQTLCEEEPLAAMIGTVVDIEEPSVIVALVTILDDNDRCRVGLSPPDESALYYMPELSAKDASAAVRKIDHWVGVADVETYLAFRSGKIGEMEIIR